MKKWIERIFFKKAKEAEVRHFNIYTLDSIPIKTFCILLDDGSKCESLGVSKENWQGIKKEFQEANPSKEERLLLEAFRKVVKSSLENTGHTMLLKVVLGIKEDWGPYFKKMGLKFKGNREQDKEYILKQIEKATNKSKIHNAQLERMEKQIREAQEKRGKQDFDIKKVNEAIASLEIAGSSIPDYDKLTYGKYEALGAIHKQRSENNGK